MAMARIKDWALNPLFLGRRMSFIAGPRQVGKTTLVQGYLQHIKQEHLYYNWDTVTTKRKFSENQLFFLENIPEAVPAPNHSAMPSFWVALDEFHKHPDWKMVLKGYYDEFGHFIRFVICGSARLDYFRRSGESLLGRYFLFKMYPMGPKDVLNAEDFDPHSAWIPGKKIPSAEPDAAFKEAVGQLMSLTGFPEPFFAGSMEFYRRWQDAHISLLTSEEVRDLSKISDIARVQLLSSLLPERVGSPLSVNSLTTSLRCAHATVKNWLEALAQIYLIFFIPPYASSLARSIKKEQKIYFWDWGIHQDGGKRFENFLAVQLMKAVSAWNECGLGKFSLQYVRTKDGRETDFLITNQGKPILLVEAKTSDKHLDKNLVYFKEKTGATLAFQVVMRADGLFSQKAPSVFVIDVNRFLLFLA
jgi:uncharacterized protein